MKDMENYDKDIKNLFDKSEKIINIIDVNYENILHDNEQFYE